MRPYNKSIMEWDSYALKKEYIDEAEIELCGLSGADEAGILFRRKGRLFRAINHEFVEDMRSIFSCGLIEELITLRLIPRTWITSEVLDGFGLVLEHEVIQPITYPREWSFSMLRDAALTELKVNLICQKYGYQLKDSHPNNVLFDAAHPMFVDVGSIVKVDPGIIGWRAYENFLRSYYYPLKIWRDGNGYIGRRILIGSETESMPHETFLIYQYPILRKLNLRHLKRVVEFYFRYRRISLIPSKMLKNRIRGLPGALVSCLRDRRMLPFLRADLSSLIRKISNFSCKAYPTGWEHYHDEIAEIYAKGEIYPRFERIIEIINEYKIKTVLEFAGNAGFLSRMIMKKCTVKRAICTDYDERAVDQMYILAKKDSVQLTPAILNFVVSTSVSCETCPSERYASEAVLALAVTHHLLLTQKVPINYILGTIARYTTKYVFIEFMPLGLYDGRHAPDLPRWYTVDWFRASFRKHFDLIIEEQLEENRILFFGELKHSDRLPEDRLATPNSSH